MYLGLNYRVRKVAKLKLRHTRYRYVLLRNRERDLMMPVLKLVVGTNTGGAFCRGYHNEQQHPPPRTAFYIT